MKRITPEVPMDVQLTIESGILCCEFDDFHEWTEKLLGHPVWTHEFAIPTMAEDLKIALVAWSEGYKWKQIRKKNPIETLMDVAPNKPIIALIKDH